MKVIKAPKRVPLTNVFSVFLAGSIEMGKAVDWQSTVANACENMKDLVLLNPRRDDWDSTWEQKIENPQFNEQVNWELDHLEASSLIVFYLDPKTTSPISLLELGAFKNHNMVVCCPEGFYRKGNVDITCRKFNIRQVKSLDELIVELKVQYNDFQNNKRAI